MQFTENFWLNFLYLIPFFILGKLIISKEISLKYICLCISFAALIVAAAGPYNENKIPTKRFLFIFDISRSVTVEDMKDEGGKQISRLQFGKEILAKAIPRLPPGTSVGIGATITGDYAFEQNATIKIFWPVVPINGENTGAFFKALAITEWWNAWGDKSEWQWFINSLAWMLDNNLEKDLNIIVITDGGGDVENLSLYINTILASKAIIKRAGAKLTFLGVGGEVSKEVKDFNENLKSTGLCFRKKDGTCFVSRLEEKNLIRLSELFGAKYSRLRGADDLLKIVNDSSAKISGLEIVKKNTDDKFLLTALLFLILFLVL